YIYIFIIFTYYLFFYILSISLSYTLYLVNIDILYFKIDKFFSLMWMLYGASKGPFY
ncbi:unnamed protein product, partial [Brassica rapa subsp. narinosa]